MSDDGQEATEQLVVAEVTVMKPTPVRTQPGAVRLPMFRLGRKVNHPLQDNVQCIIVNLHVDPENRVVLIGLDSGHCLMMAGFQYEAAWVQPQTAEYMVTNGGAMPTPKVPIIGEA